MNKKGFTLVELLAVIVILAIIALIATPIVINVVNDARDKANLRSVEGYMKAYETAYYQALLAGQTVNFDDALSVEYSGSKVTCTGLGLNDGKVTATSCTIGDDNDTTYSYDSQTGASKIKK